MNAATPPASPRVTELDYGISAIDTEYLRPLHDASHLLVEDGRAAFVDTGTNDSVPLLLAALERKGLAPADVDYVLLTHVHLDHAGGAGRLMRALPRAKAVVHPRGARHLADPAKLVEGSTAVYGETRFRELYGEILPIEERRLTIAEDGMRLNLGARELELIHTEGHARHHYCIVDRASAGIFTGDSFGVSYREFDTAAGEFIFPTTTPVHFDPEAAHATVDRLLGYRPERLYLTHYSEVRDVERLAGDLHETLDGFVALTLEHGNRADRVPALESGLFDYLSARLDAHGYEGDEEARRALLDGDVTLNAQGLLHWFDQRDSGL